MSGRVGVGDEGNGVGDVGVGDEGNMISESIGADKFAA